MFVERRPTSEIDRAPVGLAVGPLVPTGIHAVGGQAGVENVLDVLRLGIDSSLLGMGKSAIKELARDDLFVPRDFSPLDW